MSWETGTMTLRERIASGASAFLVAAAGSEDSGHPGVAERIDALREAVDSWERLGGGLRDCEPSLVAADALLAGLHDLNPEGLPQPLRDAATVMSDILDAARGEGFDASTGDLDPLEPAGSPAP